MDLGRVEDSFKMQMCLVDQVYFRIRLEISLPENRPHRQVNGYSNSIE